MNSSRSNPYNPYELPGRPQSSRLPVTLQQSPFLQPSNSQVDSYYYSHQQPKNKKQYGMFSKRYLPKQNQMSASRSRVSQYQMMSQHNMSMSGLLPQEKLYSEEMLFLLGEEDNNLSYFKDKIQGEKGRLTRDFENVRKQLQHIVADLQGSISAELDHIYTYFLNKYSEFKKHMVALRQIRRSLLSQLPQEQDDYLTRLNQPRGAASNRDLLSDIEKDAQLFRTQKIYSQISQMQKENAGPAHRIAIELIALGGLEVSYYQQSQCGKMLEGLVESIQKQAKEAYPNIRGMFVTQPQDVSPQENVLNGISEYAPEQDEGIRTFRSADAKDAFRGVQSPRKDTLKPQHEWSIQGSRKVNRPGSSGSDIPSGLSKYSRIRDKDDNPVSDIKRNQSRNYHMGNLKEPGSHISFKVTPDQQNLTAEWLQDLSMREIGTIQIQQYTNDSLLCCVFACNGSVLVVGGKDAKLRVFETSSGNLLHTLSCHKASICSLCNHGSLVSSGGDNNCNSLVTWDVRSWSVRNKVQLHSAAVTCIVDIQDGVNLASAGYDRKINIFNHKRGVVILSATNKTGIGCMTLAGDRERLVTSALDNSIAVWYLTRQGSSITNITLEKQFLNNALVCSLKALTIKGNFIVVGTKESKIQIINLLTGQTHKKLSVGTTPVVELLVLERQSKAEYPLVLSCMPKEKSFVLTKTDTGNSSLVDVKGRLNVEFGCGIGPKVVLSDNGLMAILSQSSHTKQVLLYQLTPL